MPYEDGARSALTEPHLQSEVVEMAKSGRSIKRSPFAGTVARAERRTAGRTWAPETPLAVRTSGVAVDPELRARIHQRLGWRLGKFAPRIERLSVRFEDVNGPRGGIDVACSIKAVIGDLPSVVVTELAANPRLAFDRASLRVERAVRRAIDRRPEPQTARAEGDRGARGLGPLSPVSQVDAGKREPRQARQQARPARATAPLFAEGSARPVGGRALSPRPPLSRRGNRGPGRGP